MSRRSRRRDDRNRESDPLSDLNATPVLVRKDRISPAPVARAVSNLSIIQDRRNWDPGEEPRDSVGRPARRVHKTLVVQPRDAATKRTPIFHSESWKTVGAFDDPRKAIICAQRHRRREVLFALKRTGQGSKSRKRRNEWSNIQC